MSGDFMNLAAGWLSFSTEMREGGATEAELLLMNLGFYAGAAAALVAQCNIAEQHSGEAADILVEALWTEIEQCRSELPSCEEGA